MEIKVDARGLETLIKGIERMQKSVPAAIARGLNEGGDKTRTKVQRALMKQAGFVRYASVTKRVRTVRAFAGGGGGGVSAYAIHVNGRPSKPVEFKTQVSTGPGGGVTVYMWNVAHKFKRSFQGAGKIAGQLKMRTTAPRTPLRSFDGPNLAKEAVKDQSAEAFHAAAETEVPAAVMKHLGKAL